VLLYAWNPLVTLEVAGMGHVDGLGVALMILLGVYLSHRPARPVAAGLAAAAGVLVKLVPVLGFPAWARRAGHVVPFTIAACGLMVVGLLPVILLTGGMPPGLVTYGISWEFNGPIYEPLWRLLDRIEWTSAVGFTLDGLKAATGQHEFWNQFYPLNYAQLWAKVFLAQGLLIALWAAWRRRHLVSGMLWIFGSVIVFSATVYPWYLLWVLPWAALGLQRAWLTLSATLLLSYLPQFTAISLFPWVYVAVWCPFIVLLARQAKWSSN
jgi:hypothetical protein